MEVTRVPTKHTSIRCCSQVNKQKQGFYLGLREKVDHTITSCLVIFFMLWVGICVSSCFVSRLCYFLLCGICLVWLTAVISTLDFMASGSVCKRPDPCAFWRHAEPIYSRRCVKFSGNSPLWAEVPRCSQSFSLMPVSQPASWRKIKMSIKIRLWLS